MFLIFIPLFCIFLGESQAQSQQLHCQLLRNSNAFRLSLEDFKCFFRELSVLETIDFSIKTDAPVQNITGLEVISSNFSSLTSNWCLQLPFTVEILIYSNKIEAIQEDAFVPCTKLKYLDLSENSLTTLPANMFHGNPLLTEISITFNAFLTFIDQNLFRESKKLTVLRLGSNGIENFSFQWLPKTIKHVEIYKNNLYDLEIEAITYKSLPFLEKVSFENDNLHCTRYRNIKNFFETKLKVLVKEFSGDAKCLDDETWLTKVKQNTNWTSELILTKMLKNNFPEIHRDIASLKQEHLDLEDDMQATKNLVNQFMDMIKTINGRLVEQASHDKDISFYFTTIIALFCTLIALSLATCLIMYMNKGDLSKIRANIRGHGRKNNEKIAKPAEN